MNTHFFRSFVFLFLLSGTLIFTSCEKEVLTNEISADNAKKSAQIDTATDEVESIVEETFVSQENISGRVLNQTASYFNPCVTISVEFENFTRTVTLDYGDGCTTPNGHEISGILSIVYTHIPGSMSVNIVFTYDNFTFNGIALEGGGTIERVLINDNGNPQSTAQIDVTATFPNGESAHRTGTKVREWIEGFGTGVWGDNVFEITGNWTTEFSNGDVNTGLVVIPLRRELSCQFIVSGTVELSHNGNTGVLDFGDGTCDNQATFTYPNGTVVEITLG
jgi:hypothetical protein